MAALDFTQVQTLIQSLQPDLRMLPYVMLQDFIRQHQIRVLAGLQGIDVEQELQRKGGLLRPYDPANVSADTSVGKVRDVELRLRTIYYMLKDNAQNYREKKIITAAYPNNQDKTHPLQGTIVETIIRSFSEDLMHAFWSAEYNIADQSPNGAFDGINALINDYVTAGDISVANGNQVNTGAIQPPDPADPTTATKAIDQLVDFVGKAHPRLREAGLLYITHAVYVAAIQAYENKTQYKNVDIAAIADYINMRTNSRIQIVVSEQMGSGDRIILTVPQNFDLGLNTEGDFQFVDMWRDNDDPNVWKFWIQAEAGARIRGIHRKVFQINDGNYSATLGSGDYL